MVGQGPNTYAAPCVAPMAPVTMVLPLTPADSPKPSTENGGTEDGSAGVPPVKPALSAVEGGRDLLGFDRPVDQTSVSPAKHWHSIRNTANLWLRGKYHADPG